MEYGKPTKEEVIEALASTCEFRSIESGNPAFIAQVWNAQQTEGVTIAWYETARYGDDLPFFDGDVWFVFWDRWLRDYTYRRGHLRPAEVYPVYVEGLFTPELQLSFEPDEEQQFAGVMIVDENAPYTPEAYLQMMADYIAKRGYHFGIYKSEIRQYFDGAYDSTSTCFALSRSYWGTFWDPSEVMDDITEYLACLVGVDVDSDALLTSFAGKLEAYYEEYVAGNKA